MAKFKKQLGTAFTLFKYIFPFSEEGSVWQTATRPSYNYHQPKKSYIGNTNSYYKLLVIWLSTSHDTLHLLCVNPLKALSIHNIIIINDIMFKPTLYFLK